MRPFWQNERIGNGGSGAKLPLFFHFPVIHNKPHHLPFLNPLNLPIHLHSSNLSIKEFPFPTRLTMVQLYIIDPLAINLSLTILSPFSHHSTYRK